MPKPMVFISYSHSDQHWAREFARSLQERGLSVWLDQYSVRAGEPLREALEKGLRESHVLAFLITPDTIKRPNLFFEIGAAIGMGKPVVPIISQDVDPSTLPQSLRLRKCLWKESPQATAEEFVQETVPSGQTAQRD